MKDFEFISTIDNVNPSSIWAIYLLSFLYLLFTLKKQKQKLSYLSYIFIYVGFAGVFEYTGEFVSRLFDLSVFLLVGFTILGRYKGRINEAPVRLFIIFTSVFFLSVFYHGFSDPLSDLRQYLIYSVPFLFYILFDKVKFHVNYTNEINVFVKIFNVQIIASILKLIFIGFNEKIIGTLSISGGGVAAVFPIIYFMLIWYRSRGTLSRKDWYWVLASLLVAIASNKRAIWFFFPLTLFIFFFAYKRIKFNFLTIATTVLVAFILYFGVRFNPTLNPEGKMGGSFDMSFVSDYIVRYNIGKEKEIDPKVGVGRMGTNIYYTKELFGGFFKETSLFGYGNAKFNKSGALDEENATKLGFRSKYMLTGWAAVFIKFGGIVLIVLLVALFYMIRRIKKKRDFLLMLFVFSSWFLFYSGVLYTTTLLISSFLFAIFFIQYHNNRRFIQPPASARLKRNRFAIHNKNNNSKQLK
jgi:hypothetical protein